MKPGNMNFFKFTISLLFFIFGIFGWAENSKAADHYIFSDASGSNNGSDWTNAWHDFDHVTWTRGDNYYVAAGNYITPTLNTALSGTTYIYIKSATVSEHGTDTGWDAGYVGQATWNGQLNVDTGYWDITGQYGSGEGNNPGAGTAYGIKIVPSCPAKGPIEDCTSGEARKGVMLANNVNQKDAIRLAYMDVTSCGEDHGGCNDDALQLGHVTNSIFDHLYLHDNNRASIGFVGGSTGNILQYSILARRHASHPSTPHGELLSCADTGNDNNTIRWSKFYDGQGTGVIVPQNGTQDGWEIYGNLIYVTAGNELRYNVSNGVICNGTGDTMTNAEIYNNTIYNIHQNAGTHAPPVIFSIGSGNIVSNNLFWDTGNIGSGVATRSYNLWNNNTFAAADSNGQYYSGSVSDIFNGYGSNDFSLKIATDNGTSLASPFNQDILDNTRGSDGTWDRGAYEYVSGGDDTPPTVTAFTIPSTSSSLTVSVSTFTATDDTAVTGYMLTESASAPASSDPEWSGSAPTEYVFTTEGTKTLYAWAKDAAGNVSASLNDSVTITLPTYTIGGTISGLTGTVILQNNSGDDLSRSANGSFTFATALDNGASYAVTVLTHPSGQTCTVANGSGTVSGANITNVSVSCSDNPSDSTPPVRSNYSPSGELSRGTASTTLSLSTDENATCRFSPTSGIEYSSMAYTFTGSGTTSHTYSLSGLSNGTDYSYFVRCQDANLNANTNDYAISFSVKSSSSSHKKEKQTKSKRKLSVSPKKVSRGQVLNESGKRFSKSSNVALYFSKYGGGYYPPKIVKTDAKGNFSLSYRIPFNRSAGNYNWYVVDLKTGKKSKTVNYTVK